MPSSVRKAILLIQGLLGNVVGYPGANLAPQIQIKIQIALPEIPQATGLRRMKTYIGESVGRYILGAFQQVHLEPGGALI